MSIWTYADLLPPMPDACRVGGGEGHTPLVRSRHIGPALGLEQLYFKLESSNPSGSYKDRFAAMAVAELLAADARLALGSSSGNTGAALAAYCAAAGLPCALAIVETAPEGKLKQMLAYGAQLWRIAGFGLDAAVTGDVMAGLGRLAKANGGPVVISAFCYSPVGMQGVQTISYELAEALPGLGAVFSPSGGGGLTLAVARGFERWREGSRPGCGGVRPRVHCAQPAGNDTIATPLREGAATARAVACTSSISGLQVPNVLDGTETLQACRRSGGTGWAVPDAAIYAAQSRLAREEGIYSEPAGATALAGLLAAAAEPGALDPAAPVVCLVTGTAFKDGPSIDAMLAGRGCPTLPDLGAFEAALSRL